MFCAWEPRHQMGTTGLEFVTFFSHIHRIEFWRVRISFRSGSQTIPQARFSLRSASVGLSAENRCHGLRGCAWFPHRRAHSDTNAPVTKRIDVLSDSTGETAEKVVRAAMLQYPQSGAVVRVHTRVRTQDAIRGIVEKAAQDGALVVFTVVSPELREFIHAQSYELKVEALDLIGSLIGKLSVYLDQQPINMPRGQLPLSDEYFRRIEAVEFTVKSDDGKEPRNFKKADIVLVGVSRTSKTPLSTLLAQRGLKVANLPIVLGVEPPPELEEAPEERVVGLTIGLDPLLEIRKARLRQLGMSVDAAYGLREQVREELDYAKSIFTRHPKWPVIDVTGRAIEETAVIILESLKERDEAARNARAALV